MKTTPGGRISRNKTLKTPRGEFAGNRLASPLAPYVWAARQQANAAAQHGPVRILVKDGKPVNE